MDVGNGTVKVDEIPEAEPMNKREREPKAKPHSRPVFSRESVTAQKWREQSVLRRMKGSAKLNAAEKTSKTLNSRKVTT